MQYFTINVVKGVKKEGKKCILLLFMCTYVLLFQKLYVVLHLVSD